MSDNLGTIPLSEKGKPRPARDVNEEPSLQTQDPEKSTTQPPQSDEPPYTIFTIILASFAAFISPVSSSIYYPALNSLVSDLHVTVSTINLTITVYIVCQGLAPIFVGSFSDRKGRRPAYMIYFVIYLGANIGLALQDSYAALVMLRCLQSSGSSEWYKFHPSRLIS
jgi:Na+/melibiose symporter-like transporter